MISNRFYSLLSRQQYYYYYYNNNNNIDNSYKSFSNNYFSRNNNKFFDRLLNNNLSTNISTWKNKIIDNTPYIPQGTNMSFSMEDYLLSGKEKYTKDSIDPEHFKNASNLLDKVNQLGELISYNGQITSGYRSIERQIQIYEERGEPPALGSKHLSGHALDIYDPKGELKRKILNRTVLEKAKKLGLYFENFGNTPTWVHIQDESPEFIGGQIWSADNLLEKNNL